MSLLSPCRPLPKKGGIDLAPSCQARSEDRDLLSRGRGVLANDQEVPCLRVP